MSQILSKIRPVIVPIYMTTDSPEVFKVVDTNTVIEGVDLSRFEDKIKEAAESCPVEVIKYE